MFYLLIELMLVLIDIHQLFENDTQTVDLSPIPRAPCCLFNAQEASCRAGSDGPRWLKVGI